MPPKPDRIDVDRIAKMFGLPDYDKVQESNIEYLSQAYEPALREAKEEGLSDTKAEERAQKAEEAAQDELYRTWHSAVMAAADRIFEAHALYLMPARAGERTPYEYVIRPDQGKTWDDAARKIAATIEGVGMFEIPVEDLRAAKKFVLSHLGHMSSYPEVYGTSSASRIYESSWR